MATLCSVSTGTDIQQITTQIAEHLERARSIANINHTHFINLIIDKIIDL